MFCSSQVLSVISISALSSEGSLEGFAEGAATVLSASEQASELGTPHAFSPAPSFAGTVLPVDDPEHPLDPPSLLQGLPLQSATAGGAWDRQELLPLFLDNVAHVAPLLRSFVRSVPVDKVQEEDGELTCVNGDEGEFGGRLLPPLLMLPGSVEGIENAALAAAAWVEGSLKAEEQQEGVQVLRVGVLKGAHNQQFGGELQLQASLRSRRPASAVMVGLGCSLQ